MNEGKMKKSRVQDIGKNRPSKQIAEAIIRTRVHNGFNQSSFSRYLHHNVATVGRWERAQVAPTRRVIAELLMIAPPECVTVFEDYIGKTHDQVLKERYGGLAGLPPPKIEDWGKNPKEFADKIAAVVHARTEQILAQVRSHSREAHDAAESLLAILKTTLAQVDKLHRLRGKGKMVFS